MAWFAAPEETAGGAEIRPVLASFARRWSASSRAWSGSHLVENPKQLQAFLPQLTEIFEQNRILLVLDNVESLLTGNGEWRDERWAWVVDALMSHSGLSRVVVTSRRLPVGLPGPVLVEPVHALSLEESVLLARELPRLRGLIDGTGPAADAGHAVVARVLEVVQGHPKLLELADGAAADPAELQARLAEADRAWLTRGTRLDGFLRGQAPAASGDDFGAVLAGWTRGAAAGLSSAAELLLWVVCGLEDGDRQPNVLDVVWPRLWQRAGQAGPVPDRGGVMAELVARALVVEEGDPGACVVVGWRVHPGVADAVRADTTPDLAATVDDAVADGWLSTLGDARDRETDEQTGAWVVRAARSAAPYLLRRSRWAELDHVADQVLARDTTVGAAAALAPLLQAAVETTHGRGDEGLELSLGRTHAGTVLRLDPGRGVALLEGLLAAAVTAGRYDHASALAADLVDCYRDEGRYDAALDLADRMIDYSGRAGFGPWTQLADQARRLTLLLGQGRSREVLDGVEQLREQVAGLPARPDPATERVTARSVHEGVLNIGALAALNLGLWEQAVELNAENLASMQARGASAYEQAVAAFNDYGPLVRAGRAGEARELLIGCRAVFEQVDDLANLGKTLTALANVEDTLGHLERAVDLEREALRFTYATADPEAVAVSHHNLANYLQNSGADPGLVGAHRVAASVIAAAIGSQGSLAGCLAALGWLLAAAPDRVPRSFGLVCALIGQVPGVDLAGLLARLPGPGDPDAAVQAVLTAAPGAAADAAAAGQVGRVERALAGWEPVVSALHVTVSDTDPHRRDEAAARLATELDRYADTDDWRALFAVLRRIHAGERDPDTLLAGLDDFDTAITRRALDVLAGTATVDPNAWRALAEDTIEEDPAGAFAAAVAAAATGDTTARAAVEQVLAELQTNPETAGLAVVLRRVLDGADDPSQDGDIPPDQAEFLAAVRQHLTPEPDDPET